MNNLEKNEFFQIPVITIQKQLILLFEKIENVQQLD